MREKFIKLLGILLLLLAVSCKNDKDESVEDSPYIQYETESNFNSDALVVNDIVFDKENTLWLATQLGLYSMAGDEWRYYTEEAFLTSISCLMLGPETENTIYIGTVEGVEVISGSNGQYLVKKHYDSTQANLASNSLTVIETDDSGNIWYGTRYGLSFYDGTNWIKEAYSLLRNTFITSISFLGNHYFVSTKGESMFNCTFDPNVDAITGATQLELGYFGQLTLDTVYCTLTDSENYLWFGTSIGLTQNRNGSSSSEDFQYHLVSEKVISLLEDNNGNIWAGKSNGISVYNGSIWEHYTKDDGIAGNTINCIAEDNDGILWLGTNKGVSSYNGTGWISY